MKFDQVLQKYSLDNSVLIGYYGGGNYGDELLLEVLSNLLSKQGIKKLHVLYQTPDTFSTYHHDFGYGIIPSADKKQLTKSILKSKNIIIGGGGLWGLDVALNIFVMSLMLFVAKFVLRKQVFLLGVGYYNSTSRLGHISAWLAGKSATYITARDDETQANFSRYTKRVGRDTDIAWYIKDVDLKPYAAEAAQLATTMSIKGKTLFMTLRRFKPTLKNNYAQIVTEIIANNPKMPIIIALMEPRTVDPEGYKFAMDLAKQNSNVTVVDFAYNPLTLFALFAKHSEDLAVIAPQFHTIITAYLNHVPFAPITYDNKVVELFKQIGQNETLPITDLTTASLQQFVDATSKGKGK